MGIIAPTNKTRDISRFDNSPKSLTSVIMHAANEFIESPVDGQRMTKWQAAVQRMFNTAIYAESDKDAANAFGKLADRIFGKAPVQKFDKQAEIPKVVFALNGSELTDIAKQIAGDDDAPDPFEEEPSVGITFSDGSESIV